MASLQASALFRVQPPESHPPVALRTGSASWWRSWPPRRWVKAQVSCPETDWLPTKKCHCPNFSLSVLIHVQLYQTLSPSLYVNINILLLSIIVDLLHLIAIRYEMIWYNQLVLCMQRSPLIYIFEPYPTAEAFTSNRRAGDSHVVCAVDGCIANKASPGIARVLLLIFVQMLFFASII